jgi:hypothetical protein
VRVDLWETSASGLRQAVEADPLLRSALLDADPASLSPADLLLRATLIEELGDFAEAERLAASAYEGLYTPAYRAGQRGQLDWVVRHLHGVKDAIVDLASGRADLASVLLRRSTAHVVITDLSLRILRRNRAWLNAIGALSRTSLIAFDARQTPFQDDSLPCMTTNLGLANIRDPGPLLRELRRIVSGQLYAICDFFPPDDAANRIAIEGLGLGSLLYREPALAALADAGWEVVVENAISGPAAPTPPSQIIAGAVIDALPVAPTVLEWCVLVCR